MSKVLTVFIFTQINMTFVDTNLDGNNSDFIKVSVDIKFRMEYGEAFI